LTLVLLTFVADVGQHGADPVDSAKIAGMTSSLTHGL
jgi:hypothetical protein